MPQPCLFRLDGLQLVCYLISCHAHDIRVCAWSAFREQIMHWVQQHEVLRVWSRISSATAQLVVLGVDPNLSTAVVLDQFHDRNFAAYAVALPIHRLVGHCPKNRCRQPRRSQPRIWTLSTHPVVCAATVPRSARAHDRHHGHPCPGVPTAHSTVSLTFTRRSPRIIFAPRGTPIALVLSIRLTSGTAFSILISRRQEMVQTFAPARPMVAFTSLFASAMHFACSRRWQ